MIPKPSSRLPRAALGMLCAAATLALVSCGGGGSSSDAAPDDGGGVQSVSAVRIDQRYTMRSVDTGKGLQRAVVEDSLATCNAWREAVYQLPAQTLDAALLDRLDVFERTRYLDPANARASLKSTWLVIELTDFPRWADEFKALVDAGGTDYPAQPPNCALYKQTEAASRTLWRDGTRYDIDDVKRAMVARPGHADMTAHSSDFALARRTADKGSFLGHDCTWSRSLAGDAVTSALCHWDQFPFQEVLSWPWVLDGTVTTNGMRERIEALAVELPAVLGAGGMFDLPTGYTVTTVPASLQAGAD